MEDRTLIVAANEMLCEDAYLLEAEGEIPDFAPGQFAMLRVPLADRLLRRPLGIVQADKNAVTFLYQVKGEGTRALSRVREKSGDSGRRIRSCASAFGGARLRG